jgi:hypothetical protein
MADDKYINGEEIVGPYVINRPEGPIWVRELRVARPRTIQEWNQSIVALQIPDDAIPSGLLDSMYLTAHPDLPKPVSFFRRLLHRFRFWHKEEKR